jgi:hypothetical protein
MQDGEELMSYMDTHAAFAPASGFRELSFDEIEEVGGARSERQELGCAAIGSFVGGALGIISGLATSAVAGPVAGAFMGLGFASFGTMAATGTCNSILDKGRNGAVKEK